MPSDVDRARGAAYRKRKRETKLDTLADRLSGESGALTLEAYRRKEAAGQITRPITWGSFIGENPKRAS